MSIPSVTNLSIQGLREIHPRVFGDSRGDFFETWSDRDFTDAGLTTRFVQESQSRSVRGVLRGLHFQKKRPQGKLVRVAAGEVFDVAVDLRPASPTYGDFHSVLLSSEKNNMFYIPEGFAHGFLVLSETCIYVYKCTDFYFPGDEGGLRWNDTEVAIPWPDLGMDFILSEKDRNLPSLKDLPADTFSFLASNGIR